MDDLDFEDNCWYATWRHSVISFTVMADNEELDGMYIAIATRYFSSN